MLKHRLEKGEKVVGKKIGITGQAVMNMLNVHEPDFGYLLDGMIYSNGDAIPMNSLISPRAEGEIAFILKHDLQGPGVTKADVMAATDCAMPCFEIVDFRIRAGAVMEKNSEIVSLGPGAAVLGYPAAAVAMMVNQSKEEIPAGAVLLAGALPRLWPSRPVTRSRYACRTWGGFRQLCLSGERRSFADCPSLSTR